MLRLLPIFAGAVMMLAMTATARATEWMYCSDPTDEVQVGFLLGGLDFTQVSGTTLRIGEQWWSDSPEVEKGQPLALGDYFFDWKVLNATVVDENHETVLAQLRLVVMETEDDIVKGGVMSVPGKGLYVIGCEGP